MNKATHNIIEHAIAWFLTWLCILLFLPYHSIGQEIYNFKKLSKQEGLSNRLVFSITEDGDGFMWFGTRDGLNKYDGYQFTVYKHSEDLNSIVGNDVKALVSDDATGNLYIGTDEGLSVFNRIDHTFKNYKHIPSDPNSLSQDNIRAILKDFDGKFWVSGSSGLDVFNPESEVFSKITLPDDPLSSYVEVVRNDLNNDIWIGTKKGLFRIIKEENGIKAKALNKNHPLNSASITALAFESKTEIWIGTANQGVAKWNIQTDSIDWLNQKNSGLSNDDVRSICINRKGEIWIGTFDGLSLYQPSKNRFFTYRKEDQISGGISSNSIKTIYEDKKGSLWIGTYYGGICHLDEKYGQFLNFIYSPFSMGLSSEIVSSFAEEPNGNLYIGTEGGGLNYYEPKTRSYTYYKTISGNRNTLAGLNVKQLLLEEDTLWIGTFRFGFDLFIPSRKTFRHFYHQPENPNSLSNNNVYSFLRSGSFLWIATFGGGLNIMDVKTNIFKEYRVKKNDPKSISSDLVRVIFQSKSSDIWVGTNRGLNKVILDKDGLPNNFITYLNHEKIYAINEDHMGVLWIGTISNGVFLFDPITEELIHFTEKDGLSGNTVFGILEDNQKNLWITTNNGISKYNRETGQFSNFDNSNGLYNSEFNFNAYYKTRSGDLLFGGTNGYTRFNPENIESNTYIPKIVFTALNQNNQRTKVSADGILKKNINNVDKLIFDYDEANFSIEFSALDFFSPENNHYSFLLEGIDRGWRHVIGQPSATYTIQNSGNYLFRVKGSNSDGLWNPEERQIEIIVLPPPWKTSWAYAFYFIVALAIGYTLFRIIKLRESIKLERIKKEKQKELLDLKMKFYTNITHEFRTPLTLIMGPLEDIIEDLNQRSQYLIKNRLEKIYSHTERMLNLVNQLMTFRKIEAGHEPLIIQQVELNEFVSDLFDNFSELAIDLDIDYSLEKLNNSLNIWIDKEKIHKVLSNLLANAFKFTENGGNITLKLEEQIHSVAISVHDNGAGISEELHEKIFQRFYEKGIQKQNSLIKGSGVGLSLSKQLIELHHGKISVESQLHVGSVFTISVLKGKNHFKDSDFAKESEIKNLSKEQDNWSAVPKPQSSNNSGAQRSTIITYSHIKILIIDDNTEILDYIHSIFAEDYKIVTAKDGEEGLKKVKEHQPDIVITDLMMPNMDGMAFCRFVREDFEISHIPILMVTAKTFEDDMLKGLQTGANDYITKPFHSNELKYKVQNILEQRKRLVEHIQENNGLIRADVQVTSVDEDFLTNLIKLVEDNIDNPDFNIEQFSYELAVSRSLLFSKMKALTNSTPKNFVKSYRMKRAAQLLETQKLSISEIAYQVGFKDPNYFSKVFTKEYSVPPTTFISKIT